VSFMTPKVKLVAIPTAILLLIVLFGGLVLQQRIAGQISTNVQQEMPNASGVRAAVPLRDVPNNVVSDSIKMAKIDIEKYILKGSEVSPSLSITASNISKSQPTVIGDLDVTAVISASTIATSSGFESAKIVGNALQVSVGSGGMGQALVVPKYENSQLYFELQSVSFLGNEIPASSLSPDIQEQVKARSLRTLTFPQALKVKSVALGSEGLSFKMHGSNVELDKLKSET